MINFCHHCLHPSIKCDKVSADDYDVENLISDKVFVRQRGFRAERFIVPPVSITVEFPCKVDIGRIVLDPIIGRQKSSGFEIFTASNTTKQSRLLRCDNTNEKSNEKKNESFTNITNSESVFVPVGKLFLKDPGSVCFENSSHKPRRPFCEFSTGDNDEAVYRATLRHHRVTSLSAASAVTIRIVRTVDRSSPALRRLEIWGQPAVSCPKEVQHKILNLYKAAFHAAIPFRSIPAVFQSEETEARPTPHKFTPASDIGTLRKQILQEVELNIPEDFEDPITCEIMALPLTLPSGKTIDQLTLDKHINAESAWGRPPSDPFTGLAFDNIRKPVPNVSLKLRIDQFLLSHSEALKSTPRTVGRASDLHNQHFSAISSTVRHSVPTSHPSSTTSTPSHSMKGTPRRPDHISPEMYVHGEDGSATKSEILNSKRKRAFEIETSDSYATIVKSAKIEIADCWTTRPHSHEKQLSQSLDAALLATLGSLPSYQSSRHNSSSGLKFEGSSWDVNQGSIFARHPTPKPKCAKCSSDDHAGHGHSLYSLPCGHCICKKCLLSLPKAQHSGLSSNCPACDHQFVSKDVVKLNL